jgi:hypothetical protein
MAKSLNYEPDIVLWGLCGRIGCISHFTDISEEEHIYLMQGTELICPNGQRQYWDMPYHMASIGRGFYPWEPSEIVLPTVKPFETELCKLGSLLCMESAYPTPTRELVQNGTQCITTVSGNQGFAMAGLLGGNAVYRAVEFGIPSVSYRAWGGSAVIDPYGRVLEDIALEREIVASTLVFDERRTFYRQYGDVFGYTVVFLAFLLVVYNFYLARRSPYIYCEACGADDMKGASRCWQCGASLLKPPLWKRILLHEYYEHTDRFKKGR